MLTGRTIIGCIRGISRREKLRKPVAWFGDNRLGLLSHEINRRRRGELDVTLTWAGPAPDSGDGVVFVHLYNQDNIHTEPVAQVVERPGGGALPPGNWLPGGDTRYVYLHAAG